jgi:hypothetical protein
MTQRLPTYQHRVVTVSLGNARELMTELASESVGCVITRLPYWGLRDFGVEPSVWSGEPDCRHQWTAMQRGRRKDLLFSQRPAVREAS